MKYLFIIFLLPLKVFAQDISGVWIGYMYNDTTKENIPYQLAISEFDGKLTGYSYTIFIINGVKNIGVKSIKIKEKEGHYNIVDEKFIYNNYTEPPAKGVKESSSLTLSENDSAQVLSGPWTTNATKIYNPLTGTIFLEKKKKIKPEETLIVAKLIQLGLSDKLSFLPPMVASDNMLVVNNKSNKSEKTILPSQEPAPNSNKELTPAKKSAREIREEKRKKQKEIEKEEETQQKPAQVIKKEPVILPPPPPAAEIAKRIITNIRTIEIAHDSLVFSLFDNGTVDGDTVSILLNGKVIMPRVGLLEKAVNKTIYITPDMGDSIHVIMYAENLGSIPPNTGLLVVRDGDRNYEILFSGDLKRNAEVILVRKKKS